MRYQSELNGPASAGLVSIVQSLISIVHPAFPTVHRLIPIVQSVFPIVQSLISTVHSVIRFVQRLISTVRLPVRIVQSLRCTVRRLHVTGQRLGAAGKARFAPSVPVGGQKRRGYRVHAVAPPLLPSDR